MSERNRKYCDCRNFSYPDDKISSKELKPKKLQRNTNLSPIRNGLSFDVITVQDKSCGINLLCYRWTL